MAQAGADDAPLVPPGWSKGKGKGKAVQAISSGSEDEEERAAIREDWWHQPAAEWSGRRGQKRGRGRGSSDHKWWKEKSKLMCTILRHSFRGDIHHDRRTDGTLDTGTLAANMGLSEECIFQILELDLYRSDPHFERQQVVAPNGRRCVRVRAQKGHTIEGLDPNLMEAPIGDSASHIGTMAAPPRRRDARADQWRRGWNDEEWQAWAGRGWNRRGTAEQQAASDAAAPTTGDPATGSGGSGGAHASGGWWDSNRNRY